MNPIEKLELALKLMKDRRHEMAGLGAPMLLVKEAIEEMELEIRNDELGICVNCGKVFE